MSLSFNSSFSPCIFCSYSLFDVFNLLNDMPLLSISFSIFCICCLYLLFNVFNSFLYSSSDMSLSSNSSFIFLLSHLIHQLIYLIY